VDNNGDFVVAWSSQGQDGSGWGVYARQYDHNGSPQSSEFRVNTFTLGDQRDPVVGMDDSGNFVVVWASQGQDGSGWGAYGQRFDNNAQRQGGEFRANTTTAGDQQHPSVAVDNYGNFFVTWSSPDGDGSGVWARHYDAAGVAHGNEFLV